MRLIEFNKEGANSLTLGDKDGFSHLILDEYWITICFSNENDAALAYRNIIDNVGWDKEELFHCKTLGETNKILIRSYYINNISWTSK